MTLAAARERARELDESRGRGEDPRALETARRNGHGQQATVKEFSARWMREVVEKQRRNPERVRMPLEKHIVAALGERRMNQVTGRELQAVIFGLRDRGSRLRGKAASARCDAARHPGAPASAAMVRGIAKRMWEYAMVCGVAQDTPVKATPLRYVAKRKARDRALSEEELGRALRALRRAPIAEAHRLALRVLLVTMVRKDELRQAAWSEFDLKAELWTIPAERTKMKREMLVPLTAAAVDCLRRLREMQLAAPGGAEVKLVLPARHALTWPACAGALNRSLGVVERMARVEHFTVHDLRRTASTLLTEAGWKAEVVEKALGHEIGGVRGIYNRAAYLAERREMLEAWAERLRRLEESRP